MRPQKHAPASQQVWFDWLIDYLFVLRPVENISLIWGRHHWRWRAANLDLCLALTAFSSEGSFSCNTYCDTGPRFIRSHPKDRHQRPTVGSCSLVYRALIRIREFTWKILSFLNWVNFLIFSTFGWDMTALTAFSCLCFLWMWSVRRETYFPQKMHMV
jgi:hypothetical protein